MGIDGFKRAVAKFREKLADFKSRHETTTEAISYAIEEFIPPPFAGFLKIFWNGLKPDEKSDDKLIQVISKIEEQEQSFAEVENRIQKILDMNPTGEDIKKIGQEIVSSNKSVVEILDSHLNVLNKIYKVIAKDSVSFLHLKVKDSNSQDVIYRVATAIDVKVSETVFSSIPTIINVELIREKKEEIPFIPPKGYDEWRSENKLFLSGVPGSGKTRTLVELVKIKLNSGEFGSIYVINPKNTANEKVDRASISEIVDRVSDKDLIVWDNFPNDLPSGQIIERGLESLANVSSGRVSNVFVTLDPIMSGYQREVKKLPYLTRKYVTYEIEGIKDILRFYGESISRFKSVYQKHVQQDVDRIARIIRDKEPTPLAVSLYFDELINRNLIDFPTTGIEVAERFLSNIDQDSTEAKISRYYKNLFQNIDVDKSNEAEFLYTLKLCYDLGLGRGLPFLKKLQDQIFHSLSPKEPSRDLPIWLYTSGIYYSMTDVARSAIVLAPDRMPEIIEYLAENFMNIIPDEKNSGYLFGLFFGKNIEYSDYRSTHLLLPNKLEDYLKNNFGFAAGLGEGIGQKFSSLQSKEIQERILKLGEHSEEFLEALGESLSYQFATLKDLYIQERILKLAVTNRGFTHDLAHSVGVEFLMIGDRNLKDKILQLAMQNSEFAGEFGDGFGQAISHSPITEDLLKVMEAAEKNEILADRFYFWLSINFSSLAPEVLGKVMEAAEKNDNILSKLGEGLGQNILSLRPEVQERILNLGEKNRDFAFELGRGIGAKLSLIKDPVLQEKIFRLAESNDIFSAGLGESVGVKFSSIKDPVLQEKIFRLVEKNNEFALRLGGWGHTGLGDDFANIRERELQERILLLAERNESFAKGFGGSLGDDFANIRERELQERILLLAERNESFAKGFGGSLDISSLGYDLQDLVIRSAERNEITGLHLGGGLGNSFPLLKDETIQNRIFDLADKNTEFAGEFGDSLGFHFGFIKNKNLQDRILERAEKNDAFANGMSFWIGSKFSRLDRSLYNKIFELADKNTEFASLLGDGIGQDLESVKDKDILEKVINSVMKNPAFAEGFGKGVSKKFSFLTKNIQVKIFLLAENNEIFRKFFNQGIPYEFDFITDRGILDRILLHAENDEDFAKNLSLGIGHNYSSLSDVETIDKIWALAERNTAFAYGLGEGIGGFKFRSIPEDRRQLIWKKIEFNDDFGRGLGSSLRKHFKDLDRNIQDEILESAKKSRAFAIELELDKASENKQ